MTIYILFSIKFRQSTLDNENNILIYKYYQVNYMFITTFYIITVEYILIIKRNNKTTAILYNILIYEYLYTYII